MEKLLIKNAVIYSSKGKRNADIISVDGKIANIGENLSESFDGLNIIDAKGLMVLPGIIDSQVHFREPGLEHKECIETGSKSAVLGGVTTFLEMPNTNPSTTTDVRITEKVNIGKATSYANFGFFMGATGENLEELMKVDDLEGCCGIKIFLGSSTGSLLLYDQEKLMEIFRNTTSPIAVHSENEEMLVERLPIRDAATTAHAHPEWRSEEVAFSSTKMIVELAEKAKRKIHVLHISSKKEIQYLKDHKEFISVEVLPQHLTLSAPDCYDELGTYAQMNPPIRSKEHQDALWEGLLNGTVDVLGSDHAPHTKEEKDKGYPASPSGMPGVQTIFPVMMNHVTEGKLTIERLLELLCERPADMYKMNKGYIEVGRDADFTIVDPSAEVTLTDEMMATRSGWTPYRNKTLKGFPVYTVVGGNIVMDHGKIVSGPVGKPAL